MNTTDGEILRRLAQVFALHGTDLTIEYKPTDGVYDTATATVTQDAAEELTVRGRFYRKMRRRRLQGEGEQSETWIEIQMAVLDANGITTAPQQGDCLIDGETRWAITKVEPQRGATAILTYELELSEG